MAVRMEINGLQEQLRQQKEELQSQKDAVLAEHLALAFAYGFDIDGGVSVEDALSRLGVDSAMLAEAAQLDNQLAELQIMESQLVAEALSASQDLDAQNAIALAAALHEEEEMKAKLLLHDLKFARKLSNIDEETWTAHGDEIIDPFPCPVPSALGNFPPPPRGQPAQACPTPPQATPAPRATPAPQATSAPQATLASQATPTQPSILPSPSQQQGPSGSKPSKSHSRTDVEATPGPSTSTAAVDDVAIECLRCFDRVPNCSVYFAGADAASTSSASAGCGHYFCAGCMSEYVRGAVRERKYPVLCPMASGGGVQGGCRHRLSRDVALALLDEHTQEQQAYRLLEAQSALDPRKVVYCPHKACSSPLELPDDLPPDQPTTCPACGKGFCPRCRIPGWHQGYTCAAFQQLPAHLRSAEDAAVLQMSVKQQWKRCPQCTMVVERSEGCNHVSCRCGTDFCYACGKEYRSKTPTANNVHGTPACGCPLFDVPDDDEGAAGQRRSQPVRGGRVVSRRPCRHSLSVYDCPQGPERCWFWHEEDNDN